MTSSCPRRRRSPPRSAPRWPDCSPAPSAGCARARSSSSATPTTPGGPRKATSRRSTPRRRRCSARRHVSATSSPASTERRSSHSPPGATLRDGLPDRRRHLGHHGYERTARQAGRSRHGRGRLHAASPADARDGSRCRRPDWPKLLGKPLDGAERDKALAVVRASEGVEIGGDAAAWLHRRRRGGVCRSATRGRRPTPYAPPLPPCSTALVGERLTATVSGPVGGDARPRRSPLGRRTEAVVVAGEGDLPLGGVLDDRLG